MSHNSNNNTENNLNNNLIDNYINFINSTNTSLHQMLQIIDNQQSSLNNLISNQGYNNYNGYKF